MGRNKEFDTTVVLKKAMEVFGHYGYEGTSLQILLDELGIARQSLYNTYGTKKDLFISAVKYYINEKSSDLITRLDRPGSVIETIRDIFYEVAIVLKDKIRRRQCFIMSSAIDQIPHVPEISSFFEKDTARLEQAFHKALVRARSQGELSDQHDDLIALARFLNHSRYSLTQAAKLTANSEVIDDIVKVTLSILDPA